MFNYLTIVEQRIRNAQRDGKFDQLPGEGRPLQLEDDSGVPEDLRLAYKIMKNADYLPPELAEKKEIRQMEDMLARLPDEEAKYRLIKKINYKIMKLNIVRERPLLLEEGQLYYRKVVEKCGEKS